MTRTEIEEKVREFLIDDLEIDEEKIVPEGKLKDDLGIDSLDFVDIVVIIERKFGFKNGKDRPTVTGGCSSNSSAASASSISAFTMRGFLWSCCSTCS